MGKILSYKLLGTALKSLSDACFKADEQQRNGEKVTACGMSDDDLDRLCDIIPDMLNPMLSTEEVKEKLMMAYVNEKTCNCLRGQLVLPSTPVISGYGSYCCNSTAPSTPTTGA